MQATSESLWLDVQLPDGRGQRFGVLFDAPMWLGRDPACHVVLNEPSISRRHLCLELGGGELWLRDNSQNGTEVDGDLVRRERKRVRLGSRIAAGPYVIHLTTSAETAVEDGSNAPERPGETPVARDSETVDATPGKPAPHESGEVPAGSVEGDPERSPEDRRPRTAAEVSVAQRRGIHRRLLDSLDLDRVARADVDPVEMRPKVYKALRRIAADLADELPKGEELERLLKDLCDESLGLGPLEDLIADPDVSEIMVVDPQTIFAEIKGKLSHTPFRFTDSESVRAAIERIVTPLGRRIDESTPLVDARLRDGSRVNAVIPPLAIKGPCITIRKFAKERLTLDRLVEFGTLDSRIAAFLVKAVKVRKNVVISGGTGSGKTTLLNVLSAAIPEEERVVTIEDAAELQLGQPHVVSLESRPPNMEGKGEYTIRDLVKNALRMRPDRIVVGECRGGEAIDMLQAMNTGHDGSMTTTHANSPREALSRLETLCLMSGLDLPIRAIRQQIASSVDVIIQQTRFSDGSRRITSVTEVTEVNEDGDIECFEIFGFCRSGTTPEGVIDGEFRASGYVPTFVDQFIAHGLVEEGQYL